MCRALSQWGMCHVLCCAVYQRGLHHVLCCAVQQLWFAQHAVLCKVTVWHPVLCCAV